MKRAPQQVRIGYFGKIPAHGDFIKASESVALVGLLDRWLAEAMKLLSADPRWKLNFDAMPALCFAFVGTRSRRAIAGRVVASGDLAQRRFPFLMMSAFQVDDADAFVPASPLVMGALWERFDALGAALAGAAEPAPALRAMAASVVEIEPGAAAHGAVFADFLERHSLYSLDALLDGAGFAGSARRLILALGLLLRPLRESEEAPEKSLVLPLPRALELRWPVASFWLHLIAPFLRHADFELSLFFTDIKGAPAMVVGFAGAEPRALQALIDPAVGAEQQILFEDMDWVDDEVAADYALLQLSGYLEQTRLSLKSALSLFHANLV